MYCCIYGCSNSSMKHSKSNSVKFYYFPKNSIHMPWLCEKRQKWISAVKKYTRRSNDWLPSKNTTICSAHFIGNKKSLHPKHPSYVPTIFPDEENIQQKLLIKLQRSKKHQTKMHQAKIQVSSQNDEGTSDARQIVGERDFKSSEHDSLYRVRHRERQQKYYDKNKDVINKRKRDRRREKSKKSNLQSIPATTAERNRLYRERNKEIINQRRKDSRQLQRNSQKVQIEYNINRLDTIQDITETTINNQENISSTNDNIKQEIAPRSRFSPQQQNTQHFEEICIDRIETTLKTAVFQPIIDYIGHNKTCEIKKEVEDVPSEEHVTVKKEPGVKEQSIEYYNAHDNTYLQEMGKEKEDVSSDDEFVQVKIEPVVKEENLEYYNVHDKSYLYESKIEIDDVASDEENVDVKKEPVVKEENIKYNNAYDSLN